jgi:putative sterol carrier protein
VPIPDPSATHRALGFYMNVFSLFVNRQEVARTPFTMVMEFTGPGGGVWTFHVANGACVVEERPVQRADLVMTQEPETFVKTLAEMHNPMLAMLTRQIKVRGLLKMGTFAKLFPPPKPDTMMEPAGRPAAVG